MKALLLSLFLALFCSVCAGAGENLLVNGDFSKVKENQPVAWSFSKSNLGGLGDAAAGVSYGVVTDAAAGNSLQIAVKDTTKAHLWWQQVGKALPGTSYKLSFKCLGKELDGPAERRGYSMISVVVFYLDASNQWVGSEPLTHRIPIDGEWHEVSLNVTTPDTAARIGVRLGVNTMLPVEVLYRQAELSFAN